MKGKLCGLCLGRGGQVAEAPAVERHFTRPNGGAEIGQQKLRYAGGLLERRGSIDVELQGSGHALPLFLQHLKLGQLDSVARQMKPRAAGAEALQRVLEGAVKLDASRTLGELPGPNLSETAGVSRGHLQTIE